MTFRIMQTFRIGIILRKGSSLRTGVPIHEKAWTELREPLLPESFEYAARWNTQA